MKNKQSLKNNRISIRLTDYDKKNIDAYCQKHSINTTEFFRKAKDNLLYGEEAKE
jgi:ribosomal protein S10